MSTPPKILLGQLASFGDCLYATVLARQIKNDYPGCHLTWAIGTIYRPIIEENPYVDAIWEVPLFKRADMDTAWIHFEKEAKARKKKGEFDEIFLTQIGPNNYQNFDGTVRASIYRAYPHPVSVPVQPIVRLRQEEVDAVRRFAAKNDLTRFRHVVLFECAAESSQSFVTPPYALEVASKLVQDVPDCAFILSSASPISTGHPRIIDGSQLSFRQNAELTKYCTLLVGCSSGISWLCTSDWAKPLLTIQLLRRSLSVYASMNHDAEYFGLPTNHIVEMADSSSDHLVRCLTACFSEPFGKVRATYHEQIPVELTIYFDVFMRSVLRKKQVLKIFESMFHVYKRYGAQPFIKYLASKIPGLR